jgi:hypothetical protein
MHKFLLSQGSWKLLDTQASGVNPSDFVNVSLIFIPGSPPHDLCPRIDG